jgi:hypothetical protein
VGTFSRIRPSVCLKMPKTLAHITSYQDKIYIAFPSQASMSIKQLPYRQVDIRRNEVKRNKCEPKEEIRSLIGWYSSRILDHFFKNPTFIINIYISRYALSYRNKDENLLLSIHIWLKLNRNLSGKVSKRIEITFIKSN